MQNTKFLQRVLTGCAACAILWLFFTQARIALHPVSFETGAPIAYGYGSVTFIGTVYHDQGITPLGAGTGVAIHINGAATDTTTTTATGAYTFTGLTIDPHDVITVYIDGDTKKGVLVAKLNTAELQDLSVTGMDIYKDRLILRTKTTDLTVNTLNLQLADNVGDGDVAAIYAYSGRDLRLGRDKELYVWPSTTHTASGYVFTHDLEVRGTLRMGTGTITASGSVVIPGTISTSGSTILTSVNSGELLLVTGSSLYRLYVDNGLQAYFRMDEGTGLNASGATLVTSTGGTLTNGAYWTAANTGTTLFYNPFAVELDGTNDFVTFGDAYDISDTLQKTFTAWFRRKSSDTDDVIFAKKTGSGAGTTGYMLAIDEGSDKVFFEVANGTNNYLVVSNSAITDQNWHHVAVSYHPKNTRAINIFLDGAINVGAKSGSLESAFALSGTFGNSSAFRLGATSADTSPLQGTVDDFRIYNRAMTGSEIIELDTGLKTTGSGTYYLGSDLNVNSDFCVYAGTIDVGTGYALNVAGDFCAYAGLLRTNSGVVVLDGDSQVIRGSTAFNQIAKTETSTVTLTFETNTQQTFSGAITIQGSLNNRMNIRATRTGSQSYLVAENSGAEILKHLDVKDNNASGGKVMYCSLGCNDSGNTDNWFFFTLCGDGVVSGSEACDDGDSDNNDVCPNDCQLPVCGDNVLEGLEECEPPNSGTCQSNCLLKGGGGGGGGNRSSAGSTGSFFKRPDPPDGCGNGVVDTDKGEQCDAGTRFNGIGPCSFDCKALTCGDGVISPQTGEDCEPKLKGTTGNIKVFEVATCGDTCTAPKTTAQGTTFGGCKRMFLKACSAGGSSSSEPLHGAAPGCGNGAVDPGEDCDFGGMCQGGQFDGSFWTDKASADTCKGGGGETVPASGDGCSADCSAEFCGDGFVQARGADNQPGSQDDEQCDNGSVCSNNPAKSCRLNSDCGAGGTCDYHAAKNSACSALCKQTSKSQTQPKQPVCGNGKKEQGEACDAGKSNGTPKATCSADCKKKDAEKDPACGDGIIQAQERCDDGKKNSNAAPNACRKDCTLPRCGDSVVDDTEECDSGTRNSDDSPDTCRVLCKLPICGDGIRDSNEECDGGLYCRDNCMNAVRAGTCGNGKIEAGEDCDDGNAVAGDGCGKFCQKEELKPSAVFPICGNAKLESGEECDDGNTVGGDTCSKECERVVQVKGVGASLFVLDADIVIINPDEIADALKFLDGNDPCSVLVIKGKNEKAQMIRDAAKRQGIPIVKNIPLARGIYDSIRPGEMVFGALCDEVNALRRKKLSAPMQPFPQYPTPFAYGYYNYAQVAPMIQAKPPAGDTGPALVGIAVAGAAGGLGWMRRKRRN